MSNWKFNQRTLEETLAMEEWYTPKTLVDSLLLAGDQLFEAAAGSGKFLFDLDPASSRDENVIPLSRRIFTREDDGLKQEWPKDDYIFLNPPFTNGMDKNSPLRQFIRKAVEHNNGVILCLDKPNVTVTGLLREKCSCIITFTHKLAYNCPFGKRTSKPLYYSIIYGMGEKSINHLRLFCKIYSEVEPKMGAQFMLHETIK